MEYQHWMEQKEMLISLFLGGWFVVLVGVLVCFRSWVNRRIFYNNYQSSTTFQEKNHRSQGLTALSLHPGASTSSCGGICCWMLKLQTYPWEQQADSPLGSKQIDNHLWVFKQSASASSSFPSLCAGFYVVDCKKMQVWSRLSSMSNMPWDPREVWGFALGEGWPKRVVHSCSETIISSWKSTREMKGGAICHWIVSVHANSMCWSSQWDRTYHTFPYAYFLVFVSGTGITLLNVNPEPKSNN